MNIFSVVSEQEAKRMLAGIQSGCLSDIQASFQVVTENLAGFPQNAAEGERLELLSGIAEHLMQHWADHTTTAPQNSATLRGLLLHLGCGEQSLFGYQTVSQSIH